MAPRMTSFARLSDVVKRHAPQWLCAAHLTENMSDGPHWGVAARLLCPMIYLKSTVTVVAPEVRIIVSPDAALRQKVMCGQICKRLQ